VRSCAQIGEPVDAALLMVPDASIPSVIEDLAACGAGGAVILSAGFAEAGAQGVERQQLLTRLARASGVRLLGPNCLGFVNFIDGTPLWTLSARRPIPNPTVAIVSQSGATAGQMAAFAYQQRIGITYLISTGNEADVTVAEAIEHLVDESHTRSLALFIESVRDPERFTAAIRRARAAGKTIVALKVGSSEVTAKAAQAHTGALVGDDRVFNAVCRSLGIVRVDSLEDLLITADLMARVGPVRPGGLGFLAMSGGMCEMASDQAERLGIKLPALSPTTTAQLSDVLPAFGAANNPLDVTGAAVLEPERFGTAVGALRRDPSIGLVAALFDAPATAAAVPFSDKIMSCLEAGMQGAGAPFVMFSHCLAPISKEGRALTDAHGIPYSGAGLHHGLIAAGHLLDASRRSNNDARIAGVCTRGNTTAIPVRPTGEREVLAYLLQQGVPVIPTTLATSEREAIAAARAFGGSVALKIASVQINHKSDVGGVVLNLSTDEAVRTAYHAILERVRIACPAATIDGIVVSPMRQGGIELFVGIKRDEQWGPVIAVGLGGVWVEALADTSLRLLPLGENGALEMLTELRGSRLLDGFRGAGAADRRALARAVVMIGEAALALGPTLQALEINPLLVCGDRIEALDGLAVWAGP
jgi:acetate---CoA ligase (ADP-forming)